MIQEKVNILKCLPVSVVLCILSGCATPKSIPEAPNLPESRWETTEEVIGRDQKQSDSNWFGSGSLSLSGKIIGIDSFSGNITGAPLAAQVATQKLINVASQKNITVVDRSKLEKRRQELVMAQDGFTNLTEEQQLKMIGEAISADYLLDGSVVEYSSDQKNIILNKVTEEEEVDRYAQDYKKFIERLDQLQQEIEKEFKLVSLNPVDVTGSRLTMAQQLSKIEALRTNTPTPAEYLELLENSRGRSDFRNIASVGITARLIDVRTGEFVWFYQNEQRRFSLQETMDIVAEDLIDSLLTYTPDQ